MFDLRRINLMAGLCSAVLLGGCSSTPPEPLIEQEPDQPKIEEVDVASMDLPALGEAIGPADEGRVMLNGPKTWFRAPRDDDEYLVRYNIADNKYPSIIVTVSEARDLKDLTAENLDSYAEMLQKRLDQEVDEKVTHLAHGVRKLKFKNHVGVSYITRARKGGVPWEVNTLYVIRDGRRYQFEMLCGEATAREYEPQLWATAGAIEFLPGE